MPPERSILPRCPAPSTDLIKHIFETYSFSEEFKYLIQVGYESMRRNTSGITYSS